MFSRATSMPAYTSSRIRRSLAVAGPSVQTIFALLTAATLATFGTFQQLESHAESALLLLGNADSAGYSSAVAPTRRGVRRRGGGSGGLWGGGGGGGRGGDGSPRGGPPPPPGAAPP